MIFTSTRAGYQQKYCVGGACSYLQRPLSRHHIFLVITDWMCNYLFILFPVNYTYKLCQFSLKPLYRHCLAESLVKGSVTPAKETQHVPDNNKSKSPSKTSQISLLRGGRQSVRMKVHHIFVVRRHLPAAAAMNLITFTSSSKNMDIVWTFLLQSCIHNNGFVYTRKWTN